MVTVNVCIGSACHLKGSYNIIHSLEKLSEEYGVYNQVEIAAAFCMGHCTEAVSVLIDNEVRSVSNSTVRDFFVTYILPKVVG